MSIEAVLQPRFYYAMSYFSFDAEVLFAFFAFGDTFFTLGLMVHIGLGSDRRRLAGFTGRFSRSRTSFCPHLYHQCDDSDLHHRSVLILLIIDILWVFRSTMARPTDSATF